MECSSTDYYRGRKMQTITLTADTTSPNKFGTATNMSLMTYDNKSWDKLQEQSEACLWEVSFQFERKNWSRENVKQKYRSKFAEIESMSLFSI